MEAIISHPAVQGGVAPFIVGLIVVLLLQSTRVAGLAVVAAFAVAVYFVAGFTFTPLTVTRKIILLGLLSPLIGILIDSLLKSMSVSSTVVLALAAAGASLWVFWPVLSQKSMAEAWLIGGTAAITVAFMVGFGQTYLVEDSVRAGSAVLGAGLGIGIASILSASASYGIYGISLSAGAGGLLLVQMIRGKTIVAGSTFTLPAMLTVGLVGAGAMVLANLQWYALLILALVPMGTCFPVPQRTRLWLQAVILSLCCFAIAAVACALVWLD